MTIRGLASPHPPPRSRIEPLEPVPPAWVRDLFEGAVSPAGQGRGALPGVVCREPFVRVTARIPDAADLTAADLSQRVAEQYSAIAEQLGSLRTYPLRFWNYVPGIGDSLGAGLDRYMAFNRGRYTAYTALLDGTGAFKTFVPTASAVGITGPDLVIECVASSDGGTPVDNPRQRASWRYSRRYGPRPPCFARATKTMIGGRRVLLLGGTASISGEDSQHPGNVKAQVEEVLLNMDTLIRSAGVVGREALERLTDVRIYVVHAEDAEFVETAIRARTGGSVRIEAAVARVCRPELLVEVEGVAWLSEGGG